MYGPRIICADLGAPEAIVIATEAGETVIVADHFVSEEKLAAVRLLADYLPKVDIPSPRRPHGLG